MLKVTQCFSLICIAEMFQIKGCNSEGIMPLHSDSNKKIKLPKP